MVKVAGGAPGFACHDGQDRSALPVLAEVPPGAGVSMGAMFCQLPVGLRVDRLNLRARAPLARPC